VGGTITLEEALAIEAENKRLAEENARLKAELAALKARRCETCKHVLSGYWCMTHRYSPNVNASCSDWQGEET
jgi:hypothetical protein